MYACVTGQHDLRLVGLAAVICLFACYSAFGLGARVRLARGRRPRVGWTVAAAVVTGCGVWATHFVAMLAYTTGLPVDYDGGLTALSFVAAVALAGAAFCLALGAGRPVLGGMMMGLAIAIMHYVGMSALVVPAWKHWDAVYVAASLAIGVAGGAAAFKIGSHAERICPRLLATGVLLLTIVGLHFTAMTALRLEADPTMYVVDGISAPEVLAVAIASVTALVIALGLLGSLVDQRLAERSLREAERLRAHVVELEATKRELELRTEEVTSALDAVAAASQAKTQFLASMSHELRTPLNAIIGFASMQAQELLGPVGNPTYREYSHDIQRAGEHLLTLINDILEVAKLDSSGFALDEGEVDLAGLVEDAVRAIRQRAADAGLDLRLDVGDAAVAIVADERRLRQAMHNLLSNAVKFTPSGGRVDVTLAVDADGVTVAVADTGIGIPADKIPVAFERFGQVDNSLSRRYEGAGLGLPLALQFVERHGGTLSCDSTVGRGTTMTVRLPADRLARRANAA